MNFDKPMEAGPVAEGGAEQEKEKPVVIKLHAMRHDIRENTGPAYPYEISQGIDPDNRTPLTTEGMANAASLGRDDVDLSRARAAGSPRVRSVHTAAFHMAGGREEVTGEETFDQLEKVIQEVSGAKAKFRVDNRLNFLDDKKAPLGSLLQKAYEDKVYIKTIVEQSDDFARAQGGEYTATYTGKAAQVADMFNNYFEAAGRLRTVSEGVQKVQAENFKKDILEPHGLDGELGQSTAPFERFLGTHQGLLESFMLKVVEVTEGVAARDELMTSLGAGGFDTSEGFDVTITELGGVVTGKLVYINKRPEALVQTKTITLTQELLEGIIEEYRKMNPDESTWVKKGENRLPKRDDSPDERLMSW